ncbi:MAG: transporter C-terminal domain [Herbinix sp.]|jgi:predicted RNase H-like nuclease (RuvC/YqgF family)|nr:transporter C-terminal domain [Herbinix sp.]
MVASNYPAERSTKPVRKLEQLEAFIEELEEKMSTIKKLMELHNSDGARLSELYVEHSEVEKELEVAYTEWEQLQQGL